MQHRTYLRQSGIDTTNRHFTFNSCLFNHRSLIVWKRPKTRGARGGRNDLASARLINYARIFVASADGFKEFAYSQDGGSKRMVEKSQNWLSALFSLSSLLPVVCFLRNQSVFIMIAQDSLSFGFVLFVCFVMNGKGILSQDHVPDACSYFVKS